MFVMQGILAGKFGYGTDAPQTPDTVQAIHAPMPLETAKINLRETPNDGFTAIYLGPALRRELCHYPTPG